ncbi:hypothetical protein VNI00_006411 [Paramarasmius palmivorus]|uniref:F-box domain-containing protein n=1 Tax=Paramarasmius palmivorus TaxID=297713 RepID=A0AAW0D4S8_9AGAR
MSTLAPELLEPIFLDLRDDKPSLKNCSLVDRTFLSLARPHLFHTIRLFQNNVEPFLELCNDPLETISGTIRSFTVSQNRFIESEPKDKRLQNSPALNRLLTWRSSDGKRTLTTVLSRVSTLSLAWIGWWALDDDAKRMLLEEFQSVKELKMWMTGFDTYDEFSTLVSSFKHLESLTLETIRPFRNERAESSNATQQRTVSNTLQNIALKDVQDAELIRRLTPCHALRSFHCHFVNFGDFTVERAVAIGQLLASAGSTLEEFSFTIQAAGSLNRGTVLAARFHPYIDLTKNTNLRTIKLWIEDSAFQLPFLENLTKDETGSEPHIEVLDIHYLSQLDLDWAQLDAMLQHPVYSQLREVRAYVQVTYGYSDVVGQPRTWYEAPNSDSKAARNMEKKMAEFRKKLPRTNERGILELRENYRFFDIRAWYPDLELSEELSDE